MFEVEGSLRTRFSAWCISLLLLFSVSACASAERGQSRFNSEVEVSGLELACAAIALESLRGDGQRPENFTVTIGYEEGLVEVTFVPRRLRHEERALFGGRTSFGREVHYYVDPETLTIVRRHWAR